MRCFIGEQACRNGSSSKSRPAAGQRAIPIADAKEVFRIDSYARGDLLEMKLTRLRALFNDDAELTPFLDHLINQLNEEATP